MKNWRTTTLGIVAILSAVCGVVTTFLKAGAAAGIAALPAAGSAISSGWGLIHAQDSEK